GPGDALAVEQADPPMAERVWAEARDASVPASAPDRHPKAVRRNPREQRRIRVAVLTRGEPLDERREQVWRQLGRPRSPRLGAGRPPRSARRSATRARWAPPAAGAPAPCREPGWVRSPRSRSPSPTP